MKRETELVIFDCDGVLVDSEPISIAVLRDVIASAGCDIDEATAYRLFLGRSMTTIGETLVLRYGLRFTEEHLEETRRLMSARFRAELKAIHGIRETLLALPHRRCVASSSRPERIRLSLEVAGILDLLEPAIYSATMVKRGKPAPDLFLHAASQMAADPAACIVIEDSPAGIEAAKAAGMRVFAFAGGSHAGPGGLREAFETLGPDLVFDDMQRLPALLAEASRP
ncbi:HAD family hydrolase [Neoaquamicrobium sediminum]|uniref:HAD family hydrolase n=1 Tax=Neoaquamicrobium sediminum TaxID=1849104 RepID=UPI003BAC821B